MYSVYRASYLLTLLSGCGSLLLVTIAHAQDALKVPDHDLLVQREQLQQQLTELELTLGRHNPAFIEILSSLANSSARLSLYSEASALLDRSIQIQRLSLGLFTAEQIPLILSKIDIDARAGDWETVNESMDHLSWLLIGKNVSEGETLILTLIRLAETHLQGIAADAVELQAHHYQKAFELTFQALKISERSWGASDSRHIDLYYSLLKQIYLQSAAVERGDDTAYALRAVIPGSKWVRPRRVAQTRYYRAGLRLLDEMRETISFSKEDPAESLAMIDLYTADWHLLFDQLQTEAAYEQAFVRLREANVDTAQLNLLFARPKILPIPNFHGTVSSALINGYPNRTRQQADFDIEPESALSFQAWLNNMLVIPFTDTKSKLEIIDQEQLAYIQLRFRLDSLNKVSRWIRGRYRTNRSVVAELEVLEPDKYPGIDVQTLDERLRLLHFRPRLENAVVHPSEGSLLYRMPIEQ